jgi:hypothetical protein
MFLKKRTTCSDWVRRGVILLRKNETSMLIVIVHLRESRLAHRNQKLAGVTRGSALIPLAPLCITSSHFAQAPMRWNRTRLQAVPAAAAAAAATTATTAAAAFPRNSLVAVCIRYANPYERQALMLKSLVISRTLTNAVTLHVTRIVLGNLQAHLHC